MAYAFSKVKDLVGEGDQKENVFAQESGGDGFALAGGGEQEGGGAGPTITDASGDFGGNVAETTSTSQ